MIIAVGSLVMVHLSAHRRDYLCAILCKGKPEIIIGAIHYYYEVYCFETGEKFIAFDYEMVHFNNTGLIPYYTEEKTPLDQ